MGAFAFLNLEFRPHFSPYGLSSDNFRSEYEEASLFFVQDSFPKQFILILEKEQGWNSYDDFLQIDRITKSLERDDQFEHVSSISTITIPKKGLFGYKTDTVLKLNSKAKFLKTRNYLKSLREIESKFLSKNKNYTLIFAQPSRENVLFPLDKIDQLADKDVKCSLLNTHNSVETNRSEMISESLLIATLALVVILISYYLFTASFSGLIVVFGFVGFNLGVTFCLQFLLDIPFSIAMISIPCIIIILSFSDLMHVFYLQSKFKDSCKSDDSLRLSIKNKIGKPMFLTSATNLIGFVLIFFLSSTQELTELVLISILGVIIAYISSRFVLLPLMSRKFVFIKKVKERRIIYGFINKSYQSRTLVISMAIGITVLLSAYALSNYKTDFRAKNYISNYDSNKEVKKVLANHFFGDKTIEVMVEYGEEASPWAIYSQSQLQSIEYFIDSIFSPKFMVSTNSLVRRYNLIASFGHSKAYDLRKSLKDEEIEPFIRTLGGKGLVSTDGVMTKLSFGVLSNTLEVDLEKYNELEDKLEVMSNSRVKYSLRSKSVESDRAIAEYSWKILIGLIMGIFLSALIMGVINKSIILGIGTFIVNVIPLLIGLCLLLNLESQINPQSLFLMSILVGISLDDSIYLGGYRNKKREDLVTFPLLVTSVVLGLAFTTLYFSSYVWLKEFALIFAVGVFSAYFLDIFVYPLFMKLNKK